MNPVELFKKDGTPANAWVCGVCGKIYAANSSAEGCCRCYICGEVIEQGKIGKGDFSSYHGKCWDKQQDKIRAERIAKAEKLETWDGWVYNEGPGGGPNDDYAASMDELVEYLENLLSDGDIDLADWPEYVFVCNVENCAISLREVLDNVAERMFEDWEDQLNGEGELQKAIDKFNEANKDLHSYSPDYKRVVKVPKPSQEALDALAESKDDPDA
jgi:hypothetical protein